MMTNGTCFRLDSERIWSGFPSSLGRYPWTWIGRDYLVGLGDNLGCGLGTSEHQFCQLLAPVSCPTGVISIADTWNSSIITFY